MSQEIQSRGWEERTQLGTGWDWRGENSRQWALELSISELSVSSSTVREEPGIHEGVQSCSILTVTEGNVNFSHLYPRVQGTNWLLPIPGMISCFF